MITELFQYDFFVRGLTAGVLIAMIAPLIGIFLVLRRYSLMADTLSHVSLAGIALGLLLGYNPLLTALVVSGGSAVAMEALRASKRAYGDTTLSLFLSGSLAFALVLLGLGRGFSVNIFSYLFGSIVTVSRADIWTMAGLGAVIIASVLFFYKEFVYVSFDEEAAKVSGLPVRRLNIFFMVLAALAITLSIPMVGILLVSALMVIPVVSALQLKQSFKQTLLWAEVLSVLSTVIGIVISYYLDLPSGATVVLVLLSIFLLILFVKSLSCSLSLRKGPHLP